ncbi:hypothetical protein M3I53_08665 [Paraburkholderia sp. CNPSo 3272]|uniref:hypothetical protein n=1 Tax=Paraburkholderia sp. CNPSo 3272 TaxID=2940931 RepID=UPI0020B7107E|nr:hypothetical protein [Paraburkholderia sp. CNPSo 3272]MCP3723203.1 hypothetical protein [Paraburkholderia sp. CNPSo 3272]
MKPALRMRVLLVFCAIAAAGAGYRVLVAARQMPAPVAALDSQHPNDTHARPDARRRTHPSEAAAKAAATASASAASSSAHAKLVSLRAPLSLESAHDPFTASSWLPPPPVEVPAAPVRPAPPTAPPVPFAYVGQLDAKAAKPQVFLSNADQLLIVSPGDVIDNQYRVESVSESDVVLTYLPLHERQVVAIPREDK